MAGENTSAGSWRVERQWPLYLLSVLLLIGTGIGGYLTWHHENEVYGDSTVSLANCPVTETVNCELVNSSAYSEVLGVPIALIAIPTYLLLLGLLLRRRRTPFAVAMVFTIGLLVSAYSAFLYYISTFKIGYLCLWCLRLYFINLSIPALTAAALGRNPFALLVAFMESWLAEKRLLRRAGIAFLAGLLVCIGGQRGYRRTLARVGPPGATQFAYQRDEIWREKGFKLPGKVQRVEVVGKGNSRLVDFDLQARIGQGKPIAIVVVSPGSSTGDDGSARLFEFLRRETPQIELYALAGYQAAFKPEALWESYRGLAAARDVPFLMDADFKVCRELGAVEVPSVVLIDGAGTLKATRLRDLNHLVGLGAVPFRGEAYLRQVALGQPTEALRRVPPFYPGENLIGSCAPAFKLPDLAGKTTAFPGPAKDGKPTVLFFWSATCKHCQKEIPLLMEHYRKNSGSYHVVSVTHVRRDRPDGVTFLQQTRDYVKRTGFPWPVLVDAGLVSQLYRVVSTPTTYIIGANGKIETGWFGVQGNLDAAFSQAFRGLASEGASCRTASPPVRPQLDFSMKDGKGKEASLTQFRGKPVLLHFWATWCAPCVDEMPSLLSFAPEFEKKGGRVVLVSVEEESSGPRIAEFLKSQKTTRGSYRAPFRQIADDLNLGYSVPRSYLLSPTGEVLQTYFGAQKWLDPAFKDKITAWAYPP